jgi:hypothetical protein
MTNTRLTHSISKGNQMPINITSIFEQTIAGVIVAIIAWIVSIIVSEKSRRLSLGVLKWLQLQWRYAIICLYVVIIAAVVHFVYFDWRTTVIILSSTILGWIVFLLINKRELPNVVFYDFRRPLEKWTCTENWSPEIDLQKGIKIEPHNNLTRYIKSRDIKFSTGVIELEVMLEGNAILDVIFRGEIGQSFYMARVDSRISLDRGDVYDCILHSPKGITAWNVCNKSKGQEGHTSPANEFIHVKITCRRKTAILDVNGYQVDEVKNLEIKSKETTIVIFTETANAYVKKIQFIQDS